MKKLLLLSLLAIQPLGAKKRAKNKPKKDLTLVYVSLAAMGVGGAILIYDHWSNYNTKEEESLEKRLSRLQTTKKIDLPELPKIDEGELEKWELQEEKEKSQNLINHLQARINGADEGEDTTHLQKMKDEESLEVARLEREMVIERMRKERKKIMQEMKGLEIERLEKLRLGVVDKKKIMQEVERLDEIEEEMERFEKLYIEKELKISEMEVERLGNIGAEVKRLDEIEGDVRRQRKERKRQRQEKINQEVKRLDEMERL